MATYSPAKDVEKNAGQRVGFHLVGEKDLLDLVEVDQGLGGWVRCSWVHVDGGSFQLMRRRSLES